jgi:hypothetical protein
MDGKPCTRGAFASPVRLVVADERAHSGHKRAGRGEMAPTIDQLEAMSDAEVRAVYNERAATVSERLEWYREELRRRGEAAGRNPRTPDEGDPRSYGAERRLRRGHHFSRSSTRLDVAAAAWPLQDNLVGRAVAAQVDELPIALPISREPRLQGRLVGTAPSFVRRPRRSASASRRRRNAARRSEFGRSLKWRSHAGSRPRKPRRLDADAA